MTAEPSDSLTSALGWRHEQVHLINDPESGLEGVIAIHSTVLGPAMGGLRLWSYPGGMAEALDDALRLSRAMTLKAAAAGLDLGGGKAVIVDDGDPGSRAERLVAFARQVDRLGGSYITAEDVGTTTADMDLIAEHTAHVIGRSAQEGVGGDPSPDTARTVFGAMRAALEALDGDSDLSGRRVGVVGLGKVGGRLAELLVEAGATVVAYDPSAAALDGRRDAVHMATGVEEVLTAELDVLAPCALGGLIDAEGAARLRCRVVCGAANNPLTGPEVAEVLAGFGILYVPDFLANCGGVIHVDAERRGDADGELLELALADAEHRTRGVLAEALATEGSPAKIAEQRAWSRIRTAREETLPARRSVV